MAAIEFTKRERQQLRELASVVYEAELGALLGELVRSFHQWRAGTLLASELSQTIHAFHQGESRRLWSMYQTLKEPEIVARGIALGLIADDKVPHALTDKLSSLVELFRKQ